ncbi:MAG: hypothetical protein IJ797_05170, partial [Selenomonadaceae bacterium]|nr:hypothetical protein [Selenomonadaceae bacterium]
NMILTDDTGKIKFTFKGITNINSLSNATVSVNGNSIKLTQIASPKSTTSSTTVKGLSINNYTDDTLISGTAGNDTIYSLGDVTTIKAGDGNDSVYSGYAAENVTINGGKGNDTIESNGTNIYLKYANGDGNDTITGYYSKAAIQVTGGTYTKSTIGNDVVISVGSGKMTFKDAKYKTININSSRNYVENEDERWFMADDEAYASKGFVQNDELSEIMPVNDFSSNAELYTTNSTTSTINSQLTSVTYDKNNK